jgi:type III restriction enzyme
VKLRFEPSSDYQLQAVEAVCDLFRGQEVCRTEFTVTAAAREGALISGMESVLAWGTGSRCSTRF